MAPDDRTTLPPVRVDVALKDRLTRYAMAIDRDASWVIRKAVTEYLDNHEEATDVQDPDR
jgi:predicted transcriptional regulator